jgi:N6-adenosine-specific RNA methylase IME4
MSHVNPSVVKIAPSCFSVIYADPPWTFGQSGERGAASKYDLMSLDDIKAMPIAELAADNATLLLWVTNNSLAAGLEVMRAWGFTYKTNLVWDKYYLGLGNYFRGSHEILLHGVRGRAPFAFHSQRSVVQFPRTVHSSKPAEMIPLIERVLPGERYLELFARTRPNSFSDWSVWGNEIDSDFAIPGYPIPSDFDEQEVA